jgi:hypothetical protein
MALFRADSSAGMSMAARIAMMAMTTSNSINVKSLDLSSISSLTTFSSKPES